MHQWQKCYAAGKANFQRKAKNSGLDEAKEVLYCDQRCKQLCEAQTRCEHEAKALPRSHPQKAAYMSWCAAIAEKLYEHSIVEDTTCQRQMGVSAKFYRTLVEMMSGLANGTCTVEEHQTAEKELKAGREEVKEIETQDDALRRKEAHDEIQGMLDEKPETGVITDTLEDMLLG